MTFHALIPSAPATSPSDVSPRTDAAQGHDDEQAAWSRWTSAQPEPARRAFDWRFTVLGFAVGLIIGARSLTGVQSLSGPALLVLLMLLGLFSSHVGPRKTLHPRGAVWA